MQIINVEDVKPGMVLAKTIYRGKDGRVLLRANTVLKPGYIQKIRSMQYRFLYVHDSDVEKEVDSKPAIKEVTRIKAMEAYQNVISQLKNAGNLDLAKIKEVVAEIIDYILGDLHIVYNLEDIRTKDEYTFSHGINVAVLSLMAGTIMDFRRSELEILGIGAMLHDIGKILLDPQILNKPGPLDPGEYEEMKKHTRIGYEILKSKVPISYIPAHVAYQHHEREDGSGYPLGLPGKKIHRFAKLVALADVFDAMTSDRCYRRASPVYDVIHEMLQFRNIKYDQYSMNCLLQIIAPYPLDSILLLNNGMKVEVISLARGKCMVKICEGSARGETFNLYKEPDLQVVGQIRDNKPSDLTGGLVKKNG